MADPMKIRATMQGDVADVKVLMNHPMETGLRKDSKTGQYQIEALGKTGYTATVQEFTSGVDQMLKRGAKGG